MLSENQEERLILTLSSIEAILPKMNHLIQDCIAIAYESHSPPRAHDEASFPRAEADLRAPRAQLDLAVKRIMKDPAHTHECIPTPSSLNGYQCLVVIEALSRYRRDIDLGVEMTLEDISDEFVEGTLEHFIYEPDHDYEESVIALLRIGNPPIVG